MDRADSFISTPAIDADSFDELLLQHTAIAVHFWAPWNAYDRPMDQMLSILAPKLTERVKFFSCNIDDEENHALANRCKIVTVPTLLVFFQGAAHAPLVGMRPPERLEEEIVARLVPVPPKQPWWKFWTK